RPDRFGVGEKFDAVVTQVDPKARKVSVSIKALEIAEEKEAVAQYGSTDSGGPPRDILGAGLNQAKGGGGRGVPAKPKRTSDGKAESEARGQRRSKRRGRGRVVGPVAPRRRRAIEARLLERGIMVLDAVSVVDRRRLKRRLTAWRIAAVVFAVLFLGALMLS